METCLSRWSAGGSLKTFSRRKTFSRPNVEHIPTKDWTLLKELSEVGGWLSLPQRRRRQPLEIRALQTSESSPLKKAGSKSRPTPTSWHLISPIFPRKWKLGIVVRGMNNMSQNPCGALNVKYVDTTRKILEDERHVPCGKKYSDHTEENYSNEIRCLNCRQDHRAKSRFCGVYKKEKEILEVKYKRNVTF